MSLTSLYKERHSHGARVLHVRLIREIPRAKLQGFFSERFNIPPAMRGASSPAHQHRGAPPPPPPPSPPPARPCPLPSRSKVRAQARQQRQQQHRERHTATPSTDSQPTALLPSTAPNGLVQQVDVAQIPAPRSSSPQTSMGNWPNDLESTSNSSSVPIADNTPRPPMRQEPIVRQVKDVLTPVLQEFYGMAHPPTSEQHTFFEQYGLTQSWTPAARPTPDLIVQPPTSSSPVTSSPLAASSDEHVRLSLSSLQPSTARKRARAPSAPDRRERTRHRNQEGPLNRIARQGRLAPKLSSTAPLFEAGLFEGSCRDQDRAAASVPTHAAHRDEQLCHELAQALEQDSTNSQYWRSGCAVHAQGLFEGCTGTPLDQQPFLDFPRDLVRFDYFGGSADFRAYEAPYASSSSSSSPQYSPNTHPLRVPHTVSAETTPGHAFCSLQPRPESMNTLTEMESSHTLHGGGELLDGRAHNHASYAICTDPVPYGSFFTDEPRPEVAELHLGEASCYGGEQLQNVEWPSAPTLQYGPPFATLADPLELLMQGSPYPGCDAVVEPPYSLHRYDSPTTAARPRLCEALYPWEPAEQTSTSLSATTSVPKRPMHVE
ncbi:hypothetical protein OH77DRAFT_1269445 [Trametes cingulata]|nr:hypothetical protein OH77DRAFT_1269445 [Trametes cingulata]